jgi:hypothetical protein
MVEYWWPLNIFWVLNGNHSIVQGILSAEGEVIPEAGYDYSKYYEKFGFDGVYWIELKSGKKVGKPRYPELGIIFEIGRFLLN